MTRAPAPPRPLLAAATLSSQVLGAAVFAIALLWLAPRGELDVTSVVMLAVGAGCVFAGGSAHRGSSAGLVLCAVLDTIIAIACVGGPSAVRALIGGGLARVAPGSVEHLTVLLLVTAAVGVLAAVACVAALPQARRFAAWSDERVLLAAQVSRGPG